MGRFYRHNTSLVNILLNNKELELFNFNQSFIWYQAEGAGPLNQCLRRVQNPQPQMFDPLYLENEKYFNKHNRRKIVQKKFWTVCTFQFVLVWPLLGVKGSAPKTYLYRYLENGNECLNNCWRRNVQTHRTFPLISRQWVWPFK